MSPTDEELLTRPVVIIGSPRSGTSLMGKLLEVHPDLAYVNEPRLVWRYGNDSRSDMLRPEDARPEVRRHIRRVFAERVRAEGRSRLLEKTPHNALRLGFVDAIFPDCRFVHVIRDPRESVLAIRAFWTNQSTGVQRAILSKRAREIRLRQLPHYARELLRRLAARHVPGLVRPNVWGPRIPGVEALLRDLDLLEVCCLQWRMCVEAACHYGRAMPEGRYMELRLEDLSEEVISRVMAFCDLPEEPVVLAELRRRYDPAKARSRAKQAKPAELDTILAWTEPTLRWLGYA